jgi:hypothetical protein
MYRNQGDPWQGDPGQSAQRSPLNVQVGIERRLNRYRQAEQLVDRVEDEGDGHVGDRRGGLLRTGPGASFIRSSVTAWFSVLMLWLIRMRAMEWQALAEERTAISTRALEACATPQLSPGYGSSPRAANHRIRFSVSSSARSSTSKSSSSDSSATFFALPSSFSTGLFISSRGIWFGTAV